MKHAIFDLDGTLLDTLPGISYAMNCVLTEFGLEEMTCDQLRPFVGGGIDQTIRTLFGGLDEASLQLRRSYFDREYSQVVKPMSRLFDGVGVMLDEFKVNGYGVSILSNKSQVFVDVIVDHFFGGYEFEAVVGVTDPKLKKPQADFTNGLIGKISCRDRSSIMLVGDTKFDMEAARTANLRAVGAGWGYGQADDLLLYGASIVFSTPKLLFKFLMKPDGSETSERYLKELT